MHSYCVKKGRIKEFYVDALSKDVLGFVNIFHDIVGLSSPGEGRLKTIHPSDQDQSDTSQGLEKHPILYYLSFISF